MTALVRFSCGTYTLSASVGGLPSAYSKFAAHARLHEDLGIRSTDGTALFFSVRTLVQDWPELVVALRFAPGPEAGFYPGFLLIPESDVLFVGAGTCLLAYELSTIARRLWEDVTDFGFWGWRRHGNIVLMSAETELAAWDIHGRKLWTMFVEPPWSYKVRGDCLDLDVMGRKSSFIAERGPELCK
jgi:hypothetical protein